MFLKIKSKKAEKKAAKSAKEADKIRVARKNNKKKKSKFQNPNAARKIKKTVIQTIPYERFISDYIMLVKSNIKIGKQTGNLYSKSYLIPDINYSSLPESEQEIKLLAYVDLLNGFDSSASVQVTLFNTKINKKDFEERVLLQYKEGEEDDGANEKREEINSILTEKLMLSQNGIQCKKYITVTVSAFDFETANTIVLLT